jgi:hypothetical protein
LWLEDGDRWNFHASPLDSQNSSLEGFRT